MKEETKRKISETMKRIGGNSGTWKKGRKAWNFKTGKRLKRKYIKYGGKFMLNSHKIWLQNNQLYRIPTGCVIHHIDNNSLNDNINNLQLLENSWHKSLHNFIAGEQLI